MSTRVGIAEYRVARGPAVLKAAGLGSCLAVSLYDAELSLGGLAHTLLPGRREGGPGANPAKYVDGAIRRMIDDLVEQGAERQRLVAKIAGGANMFEAEFLSLVNSIGARSAHSARQTLAELGVPLVAEDVGGNRGRTVEFDLASGRLMVYCARENSRSSL
jgi:chemotaxis protein CheD